MVDTIDLSYEEEQRRTVLIHKFYTRYYQPYRGSGTKNIWYVSKGYSITRLDLLIERERHMLTLQGNCLDNGEKLVFSFMLVKIKKKVLMTVIQPHQIDLLFIPNLLEATYRRRHQVLRLVFHKLVLEQRYDKVRRYAGGIADWERAGYPLEGNFVS